MKTTYMITDRSGQNVGGYFHTLRDAKDAIERDPLSFQVILKLRGSEFGEGFHIYKLAYIGLPNQFFGFKYIERDGVVTKLGQSKRTLYGVLEL